MRAKFLRSVTSFVAALMLTVPAMGYASTAGESPSALAMTGDALFARPVLLAMTVVGTVVYVVSLPFSLLGGNADEAGEMLVVGPAKTTFVRCLGCTQPGYKTSDVANAASDTSAAN